MDQEELAQKNRIAYNKGLRNQLTNLHQMLGEDITDVATGAAEYSLKFQPKAEEVLKTLSKLSSDLSVALIEARGSDKPLNEAESDDFEMIKGLTDKLGNLQFKLNAVIKKSREVSKDSSELTELGMQLADEILDVQEEFRKVRSDINALGALSKNPGIASLFGE